MAKIKHIETGDEFVVSSDPQWVAGTWECGDRRFMDPDGDQYEAVPDAPKVSPVEFKLLFSPQERVAIKETRSADPVIDDFFDIVEDPRLTCVNLGLQSTKDAIAYLVSKNLLTEARSAEVLSGLLK